MPVCGLPPALETMLNALLQENALSSYKIDGKGSSTVIILRLKTLTDNLDPATMKKDNYTAVYRRKCPSQVDRDRKRAAAHKKASEQKASDIVDNHSPSGLFLPTPPSLFYTDCDPHSTSIGLFEPDSRTPDCVADTTHKTNVKDGEGGQHVHTVLDRPDSECEKGQHVQTVTGRLDGECEVGQRVCDVTDRPGDGNSFVDSESGVCRQEQTSEFFVECDTVESQTLAGNVEPTLTSELLENRSVTGKDRDVSDVFERLDRDLKESNDIYKKMMETVSEKLKSACFPDRDGRASSAQSVTKTGRKRLQQSNPK